MKKLALFAALTAIILIIGLVIHGTIWPPIPAGDLSPRKTSPTAKSASLSPTAALSRSEQQAFATAEQKKISQRKALEDGLKLFRQGAHARTYARLEPVLSQSGLTALDIDLSVSLYMDVIFARSRQEHDDAVAKMRSQVGDEVYEGIENAERSNSDRARDEQLLVGLKSRVPSVPEADVSTAIAHFSRLPNFNTLFMQEVKFQPANVDIASRMRSVAEVAFDKAFADSALSPDVKEQLKKSYVDIAVSLAPRKK
jgi:hypothetical protein